MNTISTSLILILVGLSMFYPLFFYIIDKNLKRSKSAKKFLQLNYLVHLLAGGISVLLFWVLRVNYPLQISGIVYFVVITSVALYYWKVPIPQLNLFYASIIFGAIFYFRTIKELVEITPLWPGVLTGALSAGVISLTTFLFITVVKQSRKQELKKSVIGKILNYLYLFIGARVAWGVLVLFSLSVETQNNEIINALNFFIQVDFPKFILLMLFGFAVPVLFFIIYGKRLKANVPPLNYWILFVFLISIYSADFLYKYFLLQYGIVL